ncbi:MAG TPA: non-homologous end-joining DNA ligase [Solirubrobacteraceae bacterium]
MPFVAPMLATLTDERALGPGWVLERKLDGVRCLASAEGGRVALFTRNEIDRTARWPSVAAAITALGRDVVLDGEVVGMVGDDPLGFQALQQGSATIALWAFDVLLLDGEDLRPRPLEERRSLLAELVRAAGDPALRASEVLEGDSEERYREACAAGWEGLIAKRVGSPYVAGRSRDWLKLKCLAEQEVVVGGWTEPRGSRTGLGALLVGVYDKDGVMRYAGKVGTGFTRSTLDDLVAQLAPLARDTSPFAEPIKPRVAGAHWVEPRLVAQVGFQEWTRAGRLRQPRFLGLRDDKAPEEVVREAPA